MHVINILYIYWVEDLHGPRDNLQQLSSDVTRARGEEEEKGEEEEEDKVPLHKLQELGKVGTGIIMFG